MVQKSLQDQTVAEATLSPSSFPASIIGYWPLQGPFLHQSHSQECLAQGLLLGELDARCFRQPLTLQLLQASWPFCFQICSSTAGKSPSSPMFISSQRSPPPLQIWGPPTSWAFSSKWLTGSQHFLIAYYHHLCTYFHFILSPFQVFLVDQFYS